MTRCRRKPLEFECWTWDGKNEASAPKWIEVVSINHDILIYDVRGYVSLLQPGWTIIDFGSHSGRFTEREFGDEFDVVPEKPERVGCNLHENCERANVEARASGKVVGHCRDEDCEDCFGK